MKSLYTTITTFGGLLCLLCFSTSFYTPSSPIKTANFNDRTRDSLALVALYEATGGENWINRWDLLQPIDNWFGVKINNLGRVICLDLDGTGDCSWFEDKGNGLVGELPSEIGNLSSLEQLYLSKNQLSGSLPKELGNLSNLEHLHLNENNLSGSIPPELSKLAKLQWLKFKNNQLSGSIPPDLAQLSSLTQLDLSNNQLSGIIPSTFGSFKEISEINLSKNKLVGNLPSTLGNLNKLLGLYVYSNQLTGSISNSLGNCERLLELYLYDNQLTGNIPEELFNIPDLRDLALSENLLSGCIPEGFKRFCSDGPFPNQRDYHSRGTFHAFTGYNLRNNPNLPWSGDLIAWCVGEEEQIGANCDDQNASTINDQIDENCNCTGVPISCRMRDSLSLVSFYNATHETESWVNEWDLSMPMTSWYGVSVNNEGCVFGINLTDNNLNGVIPPEIGDLSELTTITLFNNKLSGNIPQEIGSLSKLILLQLFSNQLNGEIPVEIENLSNLTTLSLSHNQLTGAIPLELGNLKCLQTLVLSYNELSEPIPPEVGNIPTLLALLLSNNQLSGPIPNELGRLNKLELLNLSSNLLNGNIPAELGKLLNLKQLFLQDNMFSGCFPNELQGLCFLNNSMRVGCSTPDLQGCQYDFRNNPNLVNGGDFDSFCESGIGICEESCRQRDSLALKILYDATNGPNWIIKWDTAFSIDTWHGVFLNEEGCVTGLSLDENNLSGKLPELNLPNLITLSLNNNNLSGKIPDFSNLIRLQRLFCNKNNFTAISDFSNLINLWWFECSNNKELTTIPDFSNLPKLQWLFCHNNNISGAMPSFENLPLLRRLLLSNNNFSGCIPESLMRLCPFGEQSINESGTLDADGFNFTNNPLLPWQGNGVEWCSDTTSQVGIKCDDGISNTLNDMIQIDCFCKGEITSPDCSNTNHPDYDALMALYNNTNGQNWTNNSGWVEGSEKLSCNPCDFNGSPWFGISCTDNRVSLINLSGDETINGIGFNGNNLNGILPIEVGELTELEVLYLSGNDSLVGEIPPEIGLLNKLTFLSFRSCGFSGPIPEGLYASENLIFIELNANNLSGAILSSVGNLKNLEVLNLSSNNLSGPIPPELGNLDLKVLGLDNNNLSGCFPMELNSLCSLLETDLSVCNWLNNPCVISTSNNPLLPWQGDFSQFCEQSNQLFADCDDGDLNTSDEVISNLEDCSCQLPIVEESFPTNPIITLNNDGYNDELVFPGLDNPDIKAGKIVIYSRSGKKVYSSQSPYNNEWRGVDNSGRQLPAGTYYFVLSLDNMESIRGYITLIRN